MKINFTKKQYEQLLDIVYLGDWIANSIRVGDEQLKEYNQIFQYVGSFAKEFNQEDKVEYSRKYDEYHPTNEYAEKLYPIVEDYDDFVFWQELADRLAARDIKRSGETFDTHDDYMKRYFQLQTEYEEELAENGMENLEVRENE